MDFKDYYATLGVAKGATGKEIKQAYRKLARKHHPDVNPGDKASEARFKEVNEAYEVLSDPEKRRKYDELGSNWRMYEQAQQQGDASPFGDGSQFAGGWPVDLGEEDPFSDFFHAFFGGRAAAAGGGPRPGRGPARPRRGRDVEHELDLTLEEACSGAMRRLTVKHDGHARSVDVRIPAGVGDGSRVRVAGEGEHGSGAAAAGDLYLRVHIGRHPRFERKGKDLHTSVSVPVTTVVLGGEAEVQTLEGRTLRLKIPPTTQSGQVLRLKGHGMPSAGKPDERGDLYATIEVRLPRSLTAEQRALYEALARLEDGPTTTSEK